MDDVRQAVTDHQGESVSVFVQNDPLDWSSIPVEGRQRVFGLPAWVDDAHSATIVQMGDEAVAVVGAEPDEVALLLGALSADGSTLGDRLTAVAEAIAAHLGFP